MNRRKFLRGLLSSAAVAPVAAQFPAIVAPIEKLNEETLRPADRGWHRHRSLARQLQYHGPPQSDAEICVGAELLKDQYKGAMLQKAAANQQVAQGRIVKPPPGFKL
jgi:hypothetical protein